MADDSIPNLAVALASVDLTLPLDNDGEIEILKGVDLEIKTGEKCGLIGPSGSGKTSLLTIMAGLRRPSAGKVSIMGTDFVSSSEEELASFRRDQIGIVFQNFHLLPAMTAIENVAMPLELSSSDKAEEQAKEALEMVGLGHRLHHFPHQLSGGEQQRTAIARAFVARPSLVLADEPTGNLDGKTSDHVMEILNEMIEGSGTTMILITHNNDLLDSVDKVARMNDGRLNGK